MELTLTLSSIEPIVPIYLVTVINTLKFPKPTPGHKKSGGFGEGPPTKT